MNLFILRHGTAVERGTPGYKKDADRPLTTEGERKLGQIAKAMESLNLSFDHIYSSPYLRARQTAESVAKALGLNRRLVLSDTLTPRGSTRKLIEMLNLSRPAPESVLLVGHEPYLSGLITLLVSGCAGSSVVLKKGGLCKLATESLKHGRCAVLEWLLTPKQMALMG
ncbi:MAG TPA: phosphohistidine phosphatase SixA [Candidatus Paceibacterota bacterium]|nr:phosphohistidine phosphatase SixA [Verrucomicrobiota bacterium]HSA09232.1 phosphohistidine phosphatase SixA [Candidatus Paceibacterota bacterium]